MMVSLMAAAALQVAANPFGLSIPDAARYEETCSGLRVFAGAWCVSTPREQGAQVSDALIAEVRAKGWVMADRGASRVLFVKRKARGGCDGLQMMLMDQGETVGRSTIGFTNVPGDVCNGPMRRPDAGAGQRPPGS